MGLEPLHYRASDRVDLRALGRALPPTLRVRSAAPCGCAHTFLDSFDWRIYRREAVLLEEVGPAGARLLWRELGSGRSLGALEGARAPRFAWELPEGPFRERLGAILEGRALLAVARLRTAVRALELLNRDGKIVARLAAERSELVGEDGARGAALGERVQLLPVRGYRRSHREVARLLDASSGLSRGAEDLLLEALAALGRRPGDYSSKLDLRLPPHPASAAVREILLHLLGMLEANQEGVLRDLDAEFLHDLRVALRRTRTALRHLAAALPPAAVARFRPEFAWAGGLTGPPRDLDVYLGEFPRLRALLPAGMQPDLEPLHELLRVRRASAHDELAARLRSERWRALLVGWRALLEGAVGGEAAGEAADLATRELASESIGRLQRRVVRRGLAIGPAAPAPMLHELRKRCKDLRYLLEFFRSLYPPAPLARLVGSLRELQDVLGAFQDLEVQIAALAGFSRELGEPGKAPPEALVALGALIDRLAQRRDAARASFADRFAAFAAPAQRNLFAGLFAAAGPGAAPS